MSDFDILLQLVEISIVKGCGVWCTNEFREDFAHKKINQYKVKIKNRLIDETVF